MTLGNRETSLEFISLHLSYLFTILNSLGRSVRNQWPLPVKEYLRLSTQLTGGGGGNMQVMKRCASVAHAQPHIQLNSMEPYYICVAAAVFQ
jgi:hypothetical protein